MLSHKGEGDLIVFAALAMLFTVVSENLFSQIRPQESFTFQTEQLQSEKLVNPQFLTVARNTYRDVVFYDDRTGNITIALSAGDGTFHRTRIVAPMPPPTSLTPGNINNDGIDDFVAVYREQNKIVVFVSNKTDSLYTQQSYSVNFYPETALIADITGDKIPDIITYGKLSSGVAVLRGKNPSTFLEPKVIFGSVAVNSVNIINLNNDNIPDIVVRNWLTNEDVFYLGLGKLEFSQQTILSYGDDSTVTSFADINNDNITDVIVSSTQLSALLLYLGDGLGNYSRVQNISLQQSASHIMIGHVRSDRFNDILIQSPSSDKVTLLLSNSNANFYDGIEFGLPYESCILRCEDINGDGYSDLICFDRNSMRSSVMWNANTPYSDKLGTSVIVGKSPSNISVTDLNSDGIDDIIVSNAQSNTVSIVLGSHTQLQSQLSVEAAEQPTNVSVYSKTDSMVTLLTVHANSQMIGLITLSTDRDSLSSLVGEVEFYTIPLAGKPSFVLPDISLQSNHVSMYVFSRTQPSSITFYQQLEGTKFIAKTLTPKIPSRIIFSTIGDLNNDGISDLIYLYTDNTLQKNFLGITLNDAKAEFSGRSNSYSLPYKEIKKAFVFVEDINSDFNKDYIFYNQTEETISAVMGKREGDFGEMRMIADSVSVASIYQIQFYDYDSDGILDILVSDLRIKSLIWMKGKGNGTYLGKVKLLDIPDDSNFRCGDFNGDGKTDIVYTLPDKNLITVHYGK